MSYYANRGLLQFLRYTVISSVFFLWTLMSASAVEPGTFEYSPTGQRPFFFYGSINYSPGFMLNQGSLNLGIEDVDGMETITGIGGINAQVMFFREKDGRDWNFGYGVSYSAHRIDRSVVSENGTEISSSTTSAEDSLFMYDISPMMYFLLPIGQSRLFVTAATGPALIFYQYDDDQPKDIVMAGWSLLANIGLSLTNSISLNAGVSFKIAGVILADSDKHYAGFRSGSLTSPYIGIGFLWKNRHY